MKDPNPDLTRVNTLHREMIDGFRPLATQGAVAIGA
jgi:hypothetical protein